LTQSRKKRLGASIVAVRPCIPRKLSGPIQVSNPTWPNESRIRSAVLCHKPSIVPLPRKSEAVIQTARPLQPNRAGCRLNYSQAYQHLWITGSPPPADIDATRPPMTYQLRPSAVRSHGLKLKRISEQTERLKATLILTPLDTADCARQRVHVV